MNRRQFLATAALAAAPFARADKTLTQALAKTKFTQYAKAEGYCEGPTWMDGDVFFCSDGLLRVDKAGKVHRHADLAPAGTLRGRNGALLICDNKHKAILRLTRKGRLEVLAEKFDDKPLRSLNDLTIDSRGNLFWTDPVNSSLKNRTGHVFRLRTDGRVDRAATGMAFPNGLDVDPAGKNLFVIESITKKILRFPLRADGTLGQPVLFYNLGGSGGDGCAFDATGNLWVADFHRPETKRGRLTVLSPAGKLLGTLDSPARSLTNLTFGGPKLDELFCTTDTPNGVMHAKVGIRGFPGHPPRPMKVQRVVNE